MSDKRFTVVIKARDEAVRIVSAVSCARALLDCEVVVVDDDSADDTRSLAESAGAVVVAARSHSGAINELDKIGFEAARGRWLVRLDADERLRPQLAAELVRLSEDPTVAGVRFARRNYFCGDWLRFGGWFRSDQLRAFRADAWDRSWNFADLHSQVPVKGKVVTLPAEAELATDHYDYDSVDVFVSRSLGRYARTEAEHNFNNGVRARKIDIVYRPARRFTGKYLVQKGYKDGWRGLVIAALLAAYDISIYARMIEMQERAVGARQVPNAE